MWYIVFRDDTGNIVFDCIVNVVDRMAAFEAASQRFEETFGLIEGDFIQKPVTFDEAGVFGLQGHAIVGTDKEFEKVVDITEQIERGQ